MFISSPKIFLYESYLYILYNIFVLIKLTVKNKRPPTASCRPSLFQRLKAKSSNKVSTKKFRYPLLRMTRFVFPLDNYPVT